MPNDLRALRNKDPQAMFLEASKGNRSMCPREFLRAIGIDAPSAEFAQSLAEARDKLAA